MNNTVIKVLTEEHGKKVIKFWKSKGVETIYKGKTNEKSGHSYIYYGIIDGTFDNYNLSTIRSNNAVIIELPEDNPPFHKPHLSSSGRVLKKLKKGMVAHREGWNGSGIFIELQVPDENSKMNQPYIYINTMGVVSQNDKAYRSVVPWQPSQTDLLATDWIIQEKW